VNVLVATPWYPTPDQPNSGIFVSDQAAALSRAGLTVTILHLDAIPLKLGDQGPESLTPQLDFFQNSEIISFQSLSPSAGRYLRIPFVSPQGIGFAQRAHLARHAFKTYLHANPHFLEDFDVIHGHVICPTYDSIKDSNKPIIMTEHYSGIERVISQKPSRAMVLEALNNSSIITVSKSLRERISESLKVDLDKITEIKVIPNIVDTSSFSPKKNQSTKQEDTECKWLYVGSLKADKQVDLLIKSFKKFLDFNEHSLLIVVGDGEERRKLQKLCMDLGIANSVRFEGSVSREQVIEYLSSATIFVHLSRSETFGIASLEAILSGVPVVSIRNEGADEAWGDIEFKVGRLLSKYSDENDVARSVSEVLKRVSPESIAEAGEWIKHRYSPEVISDQLLQIYQEEISRVHRSD